MSMILIAGPCVIESEEMIMTIADYFKRNLPFDSLDFYFKASFDKANRTSINSYRGPGIDLGLKILEKVKKTYGFKILTDIHESWQAKEAASVADIIQIPAFLCRQTDLILAAAKTGKIINVKKGQFLAPWDMKNIVEKITCCNNNTVFLSERGTSFGYNNLVVDMTSIIEMKTFGFPVIFDATHSVQKPGGKGTSTGGNRQYVQSLANAALAAGADGLFIETHPNPDAALSDGPNMVNLYDLNNMLQDWLALFDLTHKTT